MSELWDAYDKNFNIINDITLIRGEPLSDGIYHLVCEIIVKHIDGTFLLMQRDSQKHYGGMWEVTAGGSALKGETVAYKWIDKNSLIEMSEDEIAVKRFGIKQIGGSGNV